MLLPRRTTPTDALRRLTSALALSLACACAALAQDPQLSFAPFASGFSQPLDVTHAGDGSGRLFVVEKTGRIRVLDAAGAPLGVFLDLTGLVSTSGERGLLGLAFAPDYPTSGRFYVNYTNTGGSTVIARYSVSAANPNLADASSAEVLLTIAQPYSNHNGGDLAFGTDGLLYVASGDGGSSNDPQGFSQNLASLLGKILRLDVDAPTGYVAAGGYPGAAPEVWAVGLRNPWRMSFDEQTGELYIGDVGQSAREEIDVAPPGATGLNFGWVCYEGTRDNRGVPSAAVSNCQAASAYDAPWFEYGHSVGRSVTGGDVYRGAAFPALQGFYVFSDYATGVTWAVRGSGSAQEAYTYGGLGSSIVGYGESEAGDLYAVGIFGEIWRVESSVALPAELTDVRVVTAGCASRLAWRAAREFAFDRYEVEVSTDGRAWTRVAERAGTDAGAYDAELPDLPRGGYARLQLVDLDGAREASATVRVPASCAGEELRAWPTLVRRGAPVHVAGGRLGEARVRGLTGEVVGAVAAGEAGAGRISTADLPAGTYVVECGAEAVRFVVW